MILGAEHKLPCGCRVVYVLNGTVCVNHDVKYCDTHSGVELARLQQEIIRQEVCSADLLTKLNTLSAQHDALAAENRVMREAHDEREAENTKLHNELADLEDRCSSLAAENRAMDGLLELAKAIRETRSGVTGG